jgi:hypothetical protein
MTTYRSGGIILIGFHQINASSSNSLGSWKLTTLDHIPIEWPKGLAWSRMGIGFDHNEIIGSIWFTSSGMSMPLCLLPAGLNFELASKAERM